MILPRQPRLFRSRAGNSRLPVIIFSGIALLSAGIFFAFTLPKLKERQQEEIKQQAAEADAAQDAAAKSARAEAQSNPANPAAAAGTGTTTGVTPAGTVVTGDPAKILEAAARGLLDGKPESLRDALGTAIVTPEVLAKLQALLGAGGYEIDPDKAVTELGRQPNLQRWSLNLRKSSNPAEKASIELDFARLADGTWKPSRLRLPGDSGDAEPQILANAEALETALGFVQSVIRQDFPAARKFVDHSRVNDATIAGLCILFEEGSFALKKDKPLVATVSKDTVSWFLAQVVSEQLQTESRFGLVLQRDAGQPWMITEINLDRILAVYASRFGEGDVYFTPLVRNPQGGDSIVLYFAYDSGELHPRTKRQIEIVSNILKADAARKLKIWGHTDAKGGEDYNTSLSKVRALAVRDALVAFGVPADQVAVEGFGATRPRRANFNPDGSDNPEGRRVNRRAEIYLDF